jgi:hypothetical protein
MKKVLLFIALIAAALSLNAQAPQSINYQAVARLTNGTPITGTAVNVGFNIREGSANGNVIYSESHTNVSTGATGLFTLSIGQGQASVGTFSTIPWASGTKFLEVLVDGAPAGTQQMMSVPYALYAEKAGNSGSNYVAGNGISINGNTISNTGDNDNNSSNEIQQITLSGNTLSLSQNGGSVQLPTGGTTVTAGNGISVIQNGSNFTVTNTGDNDNNSGNEIQQITLSGNQLSLSNGGGSVTLPVPTREIRIIEERTPNTGVDGGAATTNFTRRKLNTIIPNNNSSNISIDPNNFTFTLQPGTYIIQATAPAYKCASHQLLLRNQLTDATELVGTNAYSQTDSPGNDETVSIIYGILTIPANSTRTYRLDHWVQVTGPNSNTLGNAHATGVGTQNIYGRVIIEKID